MVPLHLYAEIFSSDLSTKARLVTNLNKTLRGKQVSTPWLGKVVLHPA